MPEPQPLHPAPHPHRHLVAVPTRPDTDGSPSSTEAAHLNALETARPRNPEATRPHILEAARPAVPRHAPADDALDQLSPLFVRKLAVYAMEVVDGARHTAQLARWVTPEVARELERRRLIASERRTMYGDQRRTVPHAGRGVFSSPRDGVVDAVVVVHTRARSHPVAMRLERRREKWRATSLTVL